MGCQFQLPIHQNTAIFIGFSVILIGSYALKLRRYNNPIFNLFSYLWILALGLWLVSIHQPELISNHYSNRLTNNAKPITIQFKIDKRLKPSSYHQKYIVQLQGINNKPNSGALLLNHSNSLPNLQLEFDKLYSVTTHLAAIPSPLNPNQFDYSKYLKQRYIYHQIYVNQDEISNLRQLSPSIFGIADKLRSKIVSSLENHSIGEAELSIIKALLLGQRQDIDNSLYNDYSKAGAVHILAVSGLHVGIITLLLLWLFNPLKRLKNGTIAIAILTITALWAFAVIAGLTSSVTRAVTMFSIITIVHLLQKTTNTYNTLAISAIIILLCKPLAILDVGFQMSYLAVIAILTFYPLLHKLWRPRYWIIRYPWRIFSVSLAAQIGVAPISIYYFNQFPGLFFISNLVIIPFLGVILGAGIIIMILAVTELLPEKVGLFYSETISLLNQFISWVADQSSFVFQDISLSLLQVLGLYALISTVYNFIKMKSIPSIKYIGLSIITCQLIWLIEFHITQTKAFTVFHRYSATIIGEKRNNKLTIFHSPTSEQRFTNTYNNYKLSQSIDTLSYKTISPFYRIGQNKILIIDTLGIYNFKHYNPDIIILSNSPKINLSRIIDQLQPKQIISDGSNFKSYVNRWHKTCEQKKIPFHNTYEKGAFIIKE